MPERSGKPKFHFGETEIIKMCVGALKRISATKPKFPFLQAISFPVRGAARSRVEKSFSLIVAAVAPEPVQEIISAATDGRFRVIPSVVLMRLHGPQILLVTFVDDRPVGQIIPGPDKLSLRLDICPVIVIQRLDTTAANALLAVQGEATRTKEIGNLCHG